MKKTSKWLFLAGFLTLAGWLINRLAYAAAVAKDRLTQYKAHYYQWKFGKIHYTVQGEGPAILLIHSTKADASAYEYNRLIGTLSKRYKVFTIDMLGYGRSDKPKITYTAYMFIQLINDFTKDIIREKVTLVTSGKSNAYATMACYQHHELYKNLVFINPESLYKLQDNPGTRDKMLKMLLEVPIIGDTIFNLKFSKASIRKAFEERIYNPTQVRDIWIDTFTESAHRSGSASRFTFSSERCHYNNVNIADAIAGINNNVYIIQGLRCDDAQCTCDDYKQINPAIECSTIDRTKGLPHMEKPESVLEVLSIYLH